MRQSMKNKRRIRLQRTCEAPRYRRLMRAFALTAPLLVILSISTASAAVTTVDSRTATGLFNAGKLVAPLATPQLCDSLKQTIALLEMRLTNIEARTNAIAGLLVEIDAMLVTEEEKLSHAHTSHDEAVIKAAIATLKEEEEKVVAEARQCKKEENAVSNAIAALQDELKLCPHRTGG